MKKILHILSWIPLLAIKIGLVLLGLMTIPIALRFGEDSKSWPKIFWIWGNDEEECPDWWIDIKSTTHWWISIWPCWWWYAIRNPVNNFRYVFKDREVKEMETNWDPDIPMEAGNMMQEGQQMAYKWSFSGPFAGYRKVWLNGLDRYSEIWFGWKIGSDVPGLGFTSQIRLNRKTGT
jgi:hypothetical protein